ncbi:Flagellar hook-length control protein FliK [Natranaerofaba carboxydovora]|nr:Flagellar hook-length control protein FliK [Natranaerofaba carboxydovora]
MVMLDQILKGDAVNDKGKLKGKDKVKDGETNNNTSFKEFFSTLLGSSDVDVNELDGAKLDQIENLDDELLDGDFLDYLTELFGDELIEELDIELDGEIMLDDIELLKDLYDTVLMIEDIGVEIEDLDFETIDDILDAIGLESTVENISAMLNELLNFEDYLDLPKTFDKNYKEENSMEKVLIALEESEDDLITLIEDDEKAAEALLALILTQQSIEDTTLKYHQENSQKANEENSELVKLLSQDFKHQQMGLNITDENAGNVGVNNLNDEDKLVKLKQVLAMELNQEWNIKDAKKSKDIENLDLEELKQLKDFLNEGIKKLKENAKKFTEEKATNNELKEYKDELKILSKAAKNEEGDKSKPKKLLENILSRAINKEDTKKYWTKALEDYNTQAHTYDSKGRLNDKSFKNQMIQQILPSDAQNDSQAKLKINALRNAIDHNTDSNNDSEIKERLSQMKANNNRYGLFNLSNLNNSGNLNRSSQSQDTTFNLQEFFNHSELENLRGNLTNRENMLNESRTLNLQNREAFVERLAEEIMKFASLKRDQNTFTLNIRLKPERLGNLRLQFTSQDGVMQGEIAAQSQQARQIIQANLTQLREQLEAQGYEFDSLDVTSDDNNTDLQYENRDNMNEGGQSNSKNNKTSLDGEDFDLFGSGEEELSEEDMVSEPGMSKVDYLV